MRLDYRDIIEILLFVAVVILLFIVIVKIGQDGTQCTLNPLIYGANELREQNNKEIICQCNLLSTSPTPTLYFNHNNTWSERLLGSETGESFTDINWTMG